MPKNLLLLSQRTTVGTVPRRFFVICLAGLDANYFDDRPRVIVKG